LFNEIINYLVKTDLKTSLSKPAINASLAFKAKAGVTNWPDKINPPLGVALGEAVRTEILTCEKWTVLNVNCILVRIIAILHMSALPATIMVA
jgi:hypothetical protein